MTLAGESERPVDKNDLFQHVNDSIRGLATASQVTDRWEFICECPDVSCHALVRLTLVEFDERRAASPPVPVVATEHDA